MHSPLQSVFFLLLFVAAVIAALLVFLFFRWTRRQPWPSRDNFQFLTDPALDGSGMVLREDAGPGWPHRVIAADPHDTSPRAGDGDNLLADLGLAHTVRAAWEVDDLTGEQLRGIRANAAALEDALVTPGLERRPGLFRYVDALSKGPAISQREWAEQYQCPLGRDADDGVTPLTFQGMPIVVDQAFAVDEAPQVARFDAIECAVGRCQTPSVCQQAGRCADTVPLSNPEA